MERVDLVVKAKYVVTLSNPLVIVDGAIAIRDGVIVGVGRESDVLSRYRGEEVVERKNHVVVPGFVDGHVHMQQFFLRISITDYYLQLPPIWTEYLIPFEEELDRGLAYLSSIASLALMVKGGTTFFVEAGAPYPEELVRAAGEIGAKGVVTYSSFDV